MKLAFGFFSNLNTTRESLLYRRKCQMMILSEGTSQSVDRQKQKKKASPPPHHSVLPRVKHRKVAHEAQPIHLKVVGGVAKSRCCRDKVLNLTALGCVSMRRARAHPSPVFFLFFFFSFSAILHFCYVDLNQFSSPFPHHTHTHTHTTHTRTHTHRIARSTSRLAPPSWTWTTTPRVVAAAAASAAAGALSSPGISPASPQPPSPSPRSDGSPLSFSCGSPTASSSHPAAAGASTRHATFHSLDVRGAYTWWLICTRGYLTYITRGGLRAVRDVGSERWM